jgi:hypothetical protein
MTARTLCTIGYEKTLLKYVLATLGGTGVATLIDVRDRPISRRPAPGRLPAPGRAFRGPARAAGGRRDRPSCAELSVVL